MNKVEIARDGMHYYIISKEGVVCYTEEVDGKVPDDVLEHVRDVLERSGE